MRNIRMLQMCAIGLFLVMLLSVSGCSPSAQRGAVQGAAGGAAAGFVNGLMWGNDPFGSAAVGAASGAAAGYIYDVQRGRY